VQLMSLLTGVKNTKLLAVLISGCKMLVDKSRDQLPFADYSTK
jgi:hypothetical protein